MLKLTYKGRCIKSNLSRSFFSKGFINLEFEKNQFEISRSSINRYFLIVKNTLNENRSSYKYISGKGLKLKNLGTKDENIFCKKLIKILVKPDFSISSVSIYYNLFNFSKVPASKFIVAFSLALKICVDTFDGFIFDEGYNNLQEYSSIKEKVNIELKDYSEEYKKKFLAFLLNLKNKKTFFEKNTENNSKFF